MTNPHVIAGGESGQHISPGRQEEQNDSVPAVGIKSNLANTGAQDPAEKTTYTRSEKRKGCSGEYQNRKEPPESVGSHLTKHIGWPYSSHIILNCEPKKTG